MSRAAIIYQEYNRSVEQRDEYDRQINGGLPRPKPKPFSDMNPSNMDRRTTYVQRYYPEFPIEELMDLRGKAEEKRLRNLAFSVIELGLHREGYIRESIEFAKEQGIEIVFSGDEATNVSVIK